jgi:cytochrome c oxidase cbb3-type subunit III
MAEWKTIGAMGVIFLLTAVSAQDNRNAVQREMLKPVVRGGIVFKAYCVLCHGERGDGVARASRLYPGLNLSITARPPGYVSKIVRRGGKAVKASEYMPPWQNELSEEQLSDVIIYLSIVTNPVRRGEVIYKNNCMLCHGVNADGKGRAAPLYHPPPSDLTRSLRDDQYKADIIKKGGAAINRSDSMPAWGEWLSDLDISDVIAFLASISQRDTAPLEPGTHSKYRNAVRSSRL